MKPNSFKSYKSELRRAAKLTHSYRKNATDFSGFVLQHAYGVSPKILLDEAVRNGIDAVYKKHGSSAKTKGVVTVYPVGNGAIAFTDNGIGITPKIASEHLLRLSNSGSTPADEIISGTAQHFGIGVKQLLNKFELIYFSKSEYSPLIAFVITADSNRLIDFDEGAIRLPSEAQLPSDTSFSAGEKSRGTTTGAGRAKSVRDFFKENETGTYLIIQPKEQGLKGYQSLLGRGKSSSNRSVVKWIESRYDYAPCQIKVARCDARGDVGAFLTVTGLFHKFSSKSTPFTFSATSPIHGDMLVHAFAGKISSGDNGQLPCYSLGGMKFKERLLIPDLSQSGHKNLLAQLGLRRLANEGLRLIVEFTDESRFTMTTDRQALVDLELSEQVQISNVFEAIAAEVELPPELTEMEEALSVKGSEDIKGCEDWLRQYSRGNAINTRREGCASGGNPSTDRDDTRSSRKKAVQSWCHWPRRTNAAPSTNEAQDGGEKGQAISGHAVVEVDFNLALDPDTDIPFSWTAPCAAYPAGVVSVCLDHSFNEIGLSLVRKALEGSKGEKVSEATVRTAYQTIKMSTIQSQLTFLVSQGLVSSLTEVKEEQIKMSLAWTYAESQLASHRRSSLIN